MGIGADDQVAAGQMTTLGQHLVADAVANIVNRRAVFFGELAHRHMGIGRFHIWRRRIMVKHQCGAFDMGQGEVGLTRAQLFDHFQRVTGTRVMDHRKINIRDDDFTGFGRFTARVIAENLLGDGMTHWGVLLKEIAEVADGFGGVILRRSCRREVPG